MTRAFGTYFGAPWPSGICDDGTQVATPYGEPCALCTELIKRLDQGSFIGTDHGLAPVHKECNLRAVLGGIGHLTHHTHWCKTIGDPDAGLTYRQSSLEVWSWVRDNGFAIS